jgi:hypothetical protein
MAVPNEALGWKSALLSSFLRLCLLKLLLLNEAAKLVDPEEDCYLFYDKPTGW